jgi:hypothetical protein
MIVMCWPAYTARVKAGEYVPTFWHDPATKRRILHEEDRHVIHSDAGERRRVSQQQAVAATRRV